MLHVIDNKQLNRSTTPVRVSTDRERSAIDAFCNISLLIDESMTEYFNLDVFSHEARLVLQLLRKQNLIIKDAWLSSRLSSRAFHELLKRMEGNGIIRIAPSLVDRRTKSIALTADFIARLLPKLRGLSEAWPQRHAAEPGA